jgi:membrane protein implicated in regulation of membrane protease activity
LTPRKKFPEWETGMVIPSKSAKGRRCSTGAYTLIELLALIFILGIATIVYTAVRKQYGLWSAVGATTLVIVACAIVVVLFYDWMARREKRRLATLREKYRGVFRVKQLPTEKKTIVKPEGAEIQVGDFGWEAYPIRPDGLIHLQGLNETWEVVWHAGFRPEQIERVADKPASQYDYWKPYWAKIPPPEPCPFPVLKRNTPTMGLPYHSGRYFIPPTNKQRATG